MSLRPEPLSPIPDVTAAAVRAAFPQGNLYVDLRTESLSENKALIREDLRSYAWQS